MTYAVEEVKRVGRRGGGSKRVDGEGVRERKKRGKSERVNGKGRGGWGRVVVWYGHIF